MTIAQELRFSGNDKVECAQDGVKQDRPEASPKRGHLPYDLTGQTHEHPGEESSEPEQENDLQDAVRHSDSRPPPSQLSPVMNRQANEKHENEQHPAQHVLDSPGLRSNTDRNPGKEEDREEPKVEGSTTPTS